MKNDTSLAQIGHFKINDRQKDQIYLWKKTWQKHLQELLKRPEDLIFVVKTGQKDGPSDLRSLTIIGFVEYFSKTSSLKMWYIFSGKSSLENCPSIFNVTNQQNTANINKLQLWSFSIPEWCQVLHSMKGTTKICD